MNLIKMIDQGQQASPKNSSRSWKNRSQRARLQKRIVANAGVSNWFIPILILMVVALLWLYLQRPAELSAEQVLLGLAIIAIGFIPTLLYFYARQRPPMPFLPMVGFYYAACFGLPLFAAHLQKQHSTALLNVEDVSIVSLWLTIGGMMSMFLAYFIGERGLWPRIRHVHLPWDGGSSKLRFFLWGCLVIHWGFYTVPLLRSMPSLGQMAEPLGFIGWGLVFVLRMTQRLSFFEKYIMFPGSLAIELIFRCTTGLLSTTIFWGVFLTVIAFRYRPKWAAILTVLSLAFFIGISPVKNQYRQLAWGGGLGNSSTVGRAVALIQLTENYYFPSGGLVPTESNAEAYASLADRMSTINFLSLVVSMTPSFVPYWNGYTYESLLTKFIPRILWPDKPQELTGNEFGHRYGFLDTGDYTTSLNLPWIVELYANFGTVGIILGMGIIGLFLAFLNQLLNRPEMNPVEFVYGSSLIFGLFYQESSFALMVGGVFSISIVLYLLLNFISAKPVSG